MGFTSWQVINRNNVFNLIIYIIDNTEDPEKVKRYITYIKISCGISFYNDFLAYIRKKDPSSPILKIN